MSQQCWVPSRAQGVFSATIFNCKNSYRLFGFQCCISSFPSKKQNVTSLHEFDYKMYYFITITCCKRI